MPETATARQDPASRVGVRRWAWAVVAGGLAGFLLLLVVLPVLSLFVSASPRELLRGLTEPPVGPAVRLTLATTTTSLALIVVCGTPVAWLLAHHQHRRGWRLVEAILQLPVVLPPAVAGVALLLAFGRRGLLGPVLEAAGIGLPFTSAAVVLAQTFVAAPFFVQAATTAFRRVDPELVLVARSLGASPARVFFSIALPTSRPGLVGGAALSWARALGEFGATLMFAGNLAGRTQTLPLAIYMALESDVHTAESLSIVLVAVAFALLVAVRAGTRT